MEVWNGDGWNGSLGGPPSRSPPLAGRAAAWTGPIGPNFLIGPAGVQP